MTVGDPEIAFVPAIKSVELTPERGGLIVEYDFASALKPVPEGVYFSWAVYLYRARSDADSATKSVELEVQDRGTGWDPAGWTILAATYYTSSPVAGNISTDAGRKQLRVFFPAGFANLEPPFYWFATQEEYRSYLPAKTIDHNIFGSVNTDCPAGVRQSPNSLPNPAKLVAAG